MDIPVSILGLFAYRSLTLGRLQRGPKEDGQHWTTVRELWMRKDKEQCESWKDEVQNVLIFVSHLSRRLVGNRHYIRNSLVYSLLL